MSQQHKYEQNQNKVDLYFNNLQYSIIDTKGKKRKILDNIDGICKGGEITAILGSSGAGKTSLLNILACRIIQNDKILLQGKVMANKIQYDQNIFQCFAAYIMQNDVLFEHFSPREAFQFVANLKYSHVEERQYQVEHTLKIMKLHSCQYSMIGGISDKGISGGERKRTSIGFELVTNPSCILLDEPTSGLDSFTAYQIINELKNLAVYHNKTIVFTIHQPSSDIYLLFDRVMLLSQGQFIYQGSRNQLIDYFSQLGFICPHTSNPMDYVMNIMHQFEVDEETFKDFLITYQQKQHSIILTEIQNASTDILTYKRVETSQIHQILIISIRAFKSMIKNKYLRVRVGIALFIGLLMGGTFFGIGQNNGTYQDFSNVCGCLNYLCTNLVMIQLNSVVLTFVIERDVFLREENSKLYSTFAYFVGKSLVDIPFCVIVPVIQFSIMYWMVGLNTDNAGKVFTHFFIAILTAFTGNSMGLTTGCIFKDVKTAKSLMWVVLLPLTMFTGFFANQKQYYVWTGWVQYLSPMKYSYEAFVTNEFDNKQYEFGDPLNILGFDIGLWMSILYLFILAIAMRILGYFFLRLLKDKLQ